MEVASMRLATRSSATNPAPRGGMATRSGRNKPDKLGGTLPHEIMLRLCGQVVQASVLSLGKAPVVVTYTSKKIKKIKEDRLSKQKKHATKRSSTKATNKPVAPVHVLLKLSSVACCCYVNEVILRHYMWLFGIKTWSSDSEILPYAPTPLAFPGMGLCDFLHAMSTSAPARCAALHISVYSKVSGGDHGKASGNPPKIGQRCCSLPAKKMTADVEVPAALWHHRHNREPVSRLQLPLMYDPSWHYVIHARMLADMHASLVILFIRAPLGEFPLFSPEDVVGKGSIQVGAKRLRRIWGNCAYNLHRTLNAVEVLYAYISETCSMLMAGAFTAVETKEGDALPLFYKAELGSILLALDDFLGDTDNEISEYLDNVRDVFDDDKALHDVIERICAFHATAAAAISKAIELCCVGESTPLWAHLPPVPESGLSLLLSDTRTMARPALMFVAGRACLAAIANNKPATGGSCSITESDIVDATTNGRDLIVDYDKRLKNTSQQMYRKEIVLSLLDLLCDDGRDRVRLMQHVTNVSGAKE